MTAAARHAAAERARLEREAANPNVSDFERDTARERLAGIPIAGFIDTDAWINPAARCRWCQRAASTHRYKPDGTPLDRFDSGSSLCPVVRDTARKGNPQAGEDRYATYYRAPLPEEAHAWREANNAAAAIRKPSKGERDAEVRERKARQVKIDV